MVLLNLVLLFTKGAITFHKVYLKYCIFYTTLWCDVMCLVIVTLKQVYFVSTVHIKIKRKREDLYSTYSLKPQVYTMLLQSIVKPTDLLVEYAFCFLDQITFSTVNTAQKSACQINLHSLYLTLINTN